jgi:hypothetical protein
LRRECEERRLREKQQETERQRLQLSNQWSADSNQQKHYQQEVESLRAVIDIRNHELSQLRNRNREIEKQVRNILARKVLINCPISN